MSPIRLWWEESKKDQIQRFYNQELGLEGNPPDACDAFISDKIIRQMLSWPSMWAVFPIQDLLGLSDDLKRDDPFEERINIPGNPNHYWRYRMHVGMESLLKETAFNTMLKKLLTHYERA
jgi:4-alpha-glucanotransferase